MPRERRASCDKSSDGACWAVVVVDDDAARVLWIRTAWDWVDRLKNDSCGPRMQWVSNNNVPMRHFTHHIDKGSFTPIGSPFLFLFVSRLSQERAGQLFVQKNNGWLCDIDGSHRTIFTGRLQATRGREREMEENRSLVESIRVSLVRTLIGPFWVSILILLGKNRFSKSSHGTSP